MDTRSTLVARVNQEFPNHFMWLRQEIPTTSWPIVSVLPVLTSIEVRAAGPHHALFVACFTGCDGKEYEVAGAYAERAMHEPVLSTDRVGFETMIEREVLRFLLLDLCGEQAPPTTTRIDYWLSLAD